MINLIIRRIVVAAATIVVMSVAFTGVVRATPIIETGYNLFETTPGSTFYFGPPVPNQQFVSFDGNPLVLFDFGDGPVDTGSTDTIIERKEVADLTSGSDTIDIEIVALSLKSVSPVDLGFGAGLEDIFIELNTSSSSVQSTMTIYDAGDVVPHGTFDSLLNFSFDVIGSIGGLYATLDKTITAINQEWSQGPTGTLVYDGVNHHLNSVDESNDFWAEGIVTHDDGAGTMIHRARSTNIPEPGIFLLVGIGLAGMAIRSRKKR